MTWIKRHMLKSTLIFCIIGVIIVLGFSYYNRQYYSRRVIHAIEQDNIAAVQELMKSPFGNLNCKSKLWISEVLSEENGATPLQVACRYGNIEIVKLLVENNANVNYVHWDEMRNGGSPLINAVSSLSENRLQVIQFLVEHGADVHYEAYTGDDALSYAVYSSSDRNDTIDVIEFLEQSGMNIYKKYSVTENTLLHKACEIDNSSIIQYLVEERNFDVNTVNADGDTSLIYFVRFASNRKQETLQFLIQHGAKKEIKNKEGKTAYNYVVERHSNFVTLLD